MCQLGDGGLDQTRKSWGGGGGGATEFGCLLFLSMIVFNWQEKGASERPSMHSHSKESHATKNVWRLRHFVAFCGILWHFVVFCGILWCFVAF